MEYSRRFFLETAIAGAGSFALRPVLANPGVTATPIAPALQRRALAALERHGERIANRDVVGIVDFSLASDAKRFHLLNVRDGTVTSHLVAHGRGSDPEHTGWLKRFSNEPHSNATSAGAFRTDSVYIGAHGRSIRLEGLDATNDNAAARGIVVHGAWYVSAEMVREHGVLGRSEGCFALDLASLAEVLARLGPDRLIYADKV